MRAVTKALVVLSAALAPMLAAASERHFTYTYESAVLTEGQREIEPWTTFRLRKDGFYNRVDQRLEFEVGLTDRLQTSLYLNAKAITQDVGGQRQSSYSFAGVSSEWKYKLFDPVADPLGLALYVEATGETDAAELEAKLILDKRIGDALIAFNLVGAREWEFAGPGTVEQETELELDLAAGYFITEHFFAGLELRNQNLFGEEGLAHSALFLGPALSYASKSWWATLTVAPQLFAPVGATVGSLDLDEQEKVQARLIFGFEL